VKLAMAREGKGYFGDGIDLSWPIGGEREVIEVSEDQAEWPFRLRERFMNGSIVEVGDDADVTPRRVAPEMGRLMLGGSPEALAHVGVPAPSMVRARAITTEELIGVAEGSSPPSRRRSSRT
jgi:hypothetical protein